MARNIGRGADPLGECEGNQMLELFLTFLSAERFSMPGQLVGRRRWGWGGRRGKRRRGGEGFAVAFPERLAKGLALLEYLPLGRKGLALLLKQPLQLSDFLMRRLFRG